jgi:hypothetical protein
VRAVKHFTPELIARGQSDDSGVLNEVEARWDELCERYRAYLDSIKGEFPPGLRHIEESYYLHDARVQAMGRRDGALVVVLQLDTPPQPLLTFTYDLVDEPRIDPGALPEAARFKGGAVEWRYDEVEKVDGHPPTWRQSVLLSNGWEVTLHFRDVKAEEAHALLPTPRNGPAGLPASAPAGCA